MNAVQKKICCFFPPGLLYLSLLYKPNSMLCAVQNLEPFFFTLMAGCAVVKVKSVFSDPFIREGKGN